jgi:hypothetical protein
VGLGSAVFLEAFVIKSVFTEPVECDAFHEACGDDAVGIDIVSGNIDAGSGDLGNSGQGHEMGITNVKLEI